MGARVAAALSRRRLLLLGPGALGLTVIGACRAKEPDTCTSLEGLGAGDIEARETLGYADRGPDPKRYCNVCSQWVDPESPGDCGGCKVLKGPIHPRGTCNAFTPKV